MNKTVVLLHLIFSTSLTKPIDEVGVIEDGHETIKMTEVRVSNDENISSLVNIDDLINDSEMVRMYNSRNLDSATRQLKETEVKDVFEQSHIKDNTPKSESNNKEDSNKEQLNTSVAKLLQGDKSVGSSDESKSNSEHKTVREVESSTMNIDTDGRTTDYIEDLANENFELFSKEEVPGEALERIEVELEGPNDESNSEWDMLDNVPIHRRMINPNSMKEEEITITSSKDNHSKSSSSSSESKSVEDNNNKSSSSSESKSVEDDNNKSSSSSESKSVEHVNFKSSSSSDSKSVEDDSSKSSQSKSIEDNISKSSESKSVEDDMLSKSIKKERIHFKFEVPNDEPNVEWDTLGNFPISRRMLNPKTIKTEEITTTGSKGDHSKSSSSSESKSVEDDNFNSSSSSESKSVEHLNSKSSSSSESKSVKDGSSKSSESKSIEDNSFKSSGSKSVEDDVLGDFPIISRRMLIPKRIKVEDITKTSSKDDNSKSSSSSESKSVEDASRSKSGKNDGSHGSTSGSGSKENQKDDETSKSVGKDYIDSDDMSRLLKKELLIDLASNKNAERENSKSDSSSKSVEESVDALKQGGYHLNNGVLRIPKTYGNLRPRVLHNHVPLDGLHRNQAIQYQPVVPVNPGNQRSITIIPPKVQHLASRESLEKSLESAESKTVDNFNYKRNSNAYPYTPDPNKTNYIYSKLLEASENAHAHNGGVSPRYVPINNLKVQYGLPNPKTFSYPPNIRPLSKAS